VNDKINVPQAADAKKHVQMTEGFKKKNIIGESYFEEMEDLDYGDMQILNMRVMVMIMRW
jgi:hypothetical protein